MPWLAAAPDALRCRRRQAPPQVRWHQSRPRRELQAPKKVPHRPRSLAGGELLARDRPRRPAELAPSSAGGRVAIQWHTEAHFLCREGMAVRSRKKPLIAVEREPRQVDGSAAAPSRQIAASCGSSSAQAPARPQPASGGAGGSGWPDESSSPTVDRATPRAAHGLHTLPRIQDRSRSAWPRAAAGRGLRKPSTWLP